MLGGQGNCVRKYITNFIEVNGAVRICSGNLCMLRDQAKTYVSKYIFKLNS